MNALTNKFTIFLFLSLLNISYGQMNLDWVGRYSGSGSLEDSGNSIFVDDSGYVYVTGSVQVSFGYLCTTIKYNKYGNILWVRNYQRAGSTNNQGHDLKVDDSGYVYVAGAVSMLKYNHIGDLIWARYDTAVLNKIVIDPAGKIYAGGTGGGYFVVVKYDKFGNREWKVKYPGSYKLQDMTLDNYGNIIFTGEGQHAGTSYDYNTFKYSNIGQLLWVRVYNGLGPWPNSEDTPYSVTTDDDGNVYVTGASMDASSNYNNVTIKYDSSGDTIWIKRRYPPTNGYDIEVDKNQNVYITSRSTGNNFASKLDINGNVIWMRGYPITNGLTTNRSVILLDSINNVYVTANIDSNSYTHYGAIKYDNNGNQIFVVTYKNSPQRIDYVYDMAIDKKGSVYLTGTSQAAGTYYDFATVKFSEIITNISGNNFQTIGYRLEQNYPNPFNPVTNLEFRLADMGFVTLKIYDILGNEVATLVNERKNAGIYKTEFDGSNYPSGVYLYRLQVDENIIDTRRMALIK